MAPRSSRCAQRGWHAREDHRAILRNDKQLKASICTHAAKSASSGHRLAGGRWRMGARGGRWPLLLPKQAHTP